MTVSMHGSLLCGIGKNELLQIVFEMICTRQHIAEARGLVILTLEDHPLNLCDLPDVDISY